MKKSFKIYTALFITIITLFSISSCSISNIFEDMLYMFIKNDTNLAITVTVQEDPDTASAKKFGPQVQKLTIAPGKTKRTDIVDNSYFMLSIHEKQVLPVTPEYDYGSNKYHYIGKNALVTITCFNDEYQYDFTPNHSL